MHLDKITPDKHVNDRVVLLFENGEKVNCFTENVADFSLHSDMELDDDTYESLLAAIAFSRTRRRAAAVVSSRAISRGELKSRLMEKGESEEDSQAAVDRLSLAGALNDSEYAASIVRHYAGRGYGKGRIKAEFSKRKIPRGLWEDALAGMPDMSERINDLLRSKLQGKQTDKMLLKKAADALYRRGYSWEEINDAIRRFGDPGAMEE